MAKPKKPAANNNALGQDAQTESQENANGAAETTQPVETDEEKAAREQKEAEEKKKRKEAREQQTAAQTTVAHSFKKLAELVNLHLTAGNMLFGEKDGSETESDVVFEVINIGDRALEVGFPKLDKPKAARGATVNELKDQRSEATRRFLEKEITEEEWSSLTYSIENKIKRLQAAEKKKAEAQNAPPPPTAEEAPASAGA